MIIAGTVLLVAGSVFAALGALGVLRFPDLYTRLHAASKTGPLGGGLILLGAGLITGDPWTIVRTIVGLVFLLLVSPVSAHLLARAAVKSGVQPNSITSINEMQNSR
jgi:multicomponent Na+:H+ antiporter subunit G